MNPSPTVDPRVARDLADGLYRQGVMASVISAVIGAVIVGVMWSRIPLDTLGIWYALVLANQTFRVALVRAFRRAQAKELDPALWLRRYTWTMAAGGAIFGSVAVVMFPAGDPLAQAFLVVMVFGLASGALSANAYHRPALVAHMFLMLMPMILRLAVTGGTEYGALTFTTAFGLLVILAFGLRQSRILSESIALRYQNVDLIDELKSKTSIAEAAQQRAEQASLAKSQFFAAASHDLRQPLQALGLYAASFRQTRREPEDTRNIDQILASVDALESLFDELLDISKLDAGYVHPNLSHFPARAIFDRLEATFTPIARKQGLALAFDSGDAILRNDSILLERVLSNLVSNALRYTEAGGVTVRCRPGAEITMLEIEDTGIGIPRAEHERIFDEFYQIGNPGRDRKRGLGLGLATVRRIAQLLGTPLTLESAPGRGSTFRLEVRTGNATQVASAPPATALGEANALAGRFIAVMEDDDSVREGLVQLLRSWHCEVAAAPSAAGAIARLTRAPHAIIADYRLKNHETGVAAISALREHFGVTIPAILVSGDTAPEIFAAAIERRLPMLTKPVRAGRLRAALISLLASTRAAA